MEEKLFRCGTIRIETDAGTKATTVCRGMTILTHDGHAAGSVAAVILDPDTNDTTHLVLGRFHPSLSYHVVPIRIVERVEEETVRIRITDEEVDALPAHQH